MRSLRYWPRTSPLLNPRSKFFTAILAEKNWSPSECAKRGCSGIPMGPEFVPDFVLSSTSELPISENKFQIPVSWCKHLEKLAATSERFTGADIAGVCMKRGCTLCGIIRKREASPWNISFRRLRKKFLRLRKK
jgi:hypothetical protein